MDDNYEYIKSKNSNLVREYNQLLTTEDNKKKAGSKFKFMFQSNFLIFEQSVKKWLSSLYIDWLKNITIIDYKYMRQSDYERYNHNAIDEKGENKIKEDIHKQLIYEWTVQQNFENSETTSEFWIPYYSDNLDFETSRFDITDSASNEFKKSQIKVMKVNFKTLQENYVKLSNAL